MPLGQEGFEMQAEPAESEDNFITVAFRFISRLASRARIKVYELSPIVGRKAEEVKEEAKEPPAPEIVGNPITLTDFNNTLRAKFPTLTTVPMFTKGNFDNALIEASSRKRPLVVYLQEDRKDPNPQTFLENTLCHPETNRILVQIFITNLYY